jgi:hypothetical protein
MTILQSEPNTTYRKYKEAVHMLCTNYLVSQPSLDISTIWFPLIDTIVQRNEVFIHDMHECLCSVVGAWLY